MIDGMGQIMRRGRCAIHLRNVPALHIPSGTLIAVTGRGWLYGRGHDYATEMGSVALLPTIALVLLYSSCRYLPFTEVCDEIGSVDASDRFPRVMGARIPFPSNKVLLCLSLFAFIENLLYFPFFFSFDEIGRWFLKIDPVLLRFHIGM